MNSYDRAQARADKIGDNIAALAARGVCSHGRIKTAPTGDFLSMPATCLECGAEFLTARGAMADHAKIARSGA